MKNKISLVSKHKILVFLTLFSLCLIVVGFLHIPILSWCGVNVFALRGILVITALPIVAIFSIPFAICVVKWLNLFKQDKTDKKVED